MGERQAERSQECDITRKGLVAREKPCPTPLHQSGSHEVLSHACVHDERSAVCIHAREPLYYNPAQVSYRALTRFFCPRRSVFPLMFRRPPPASLFTRRTRDRRSAGDDGIRACVRSAAFAPRAHTHSCTAQTHARTRERSSIRGNAEDGDLLLLSLLRVSFAPFLGLGFFYSEELLREFCRCGRVGD